MTSPRSPLPTSEMTVNESMEQSRREEDAERAASRPIGEGYTGNPCGVCGRIRVFLRADGRAQCEKCETIFPAASPPSLDAPAEIPSSIQQERDRLAYRMEFVASWLRPIVALGPDRLCEFNTDSLIADAILGQGWYADNAYMDSVIAYKSNAYEHQWNRYVNHTTEFESVIAAYHQLRAAIERLQKEIWDLSQKNAGLSLTSQQVAKAWKDREAELSALRSTALTPRQASALLMVCEGAGDFSPEELTPEEIQDCIANLRSLSSLRSSSLQNTSD